MCIVCPKCVSGELFREFEPEADFGDTLEEYITVVVCCKQCDQESRFKYVFCEEESDD